MNVISCRLKRKGGRSIIMPHVFFEPLERRQSTQTLFSGFPEFIAYYGISPGYPGSGYTPPETPRLLYGVSPQPEYPTGGFFPWWPGGAYGGSGYNQWTNPMNNYNSWGSWGGFTPIWNSLGGLFGGSFSGWSWRRNQPSVPDFRLLYGVFPTSQPLSGAGNSPEPITKIIDFYGVSFPDSVSTLFSGF